MARIKKMEKGGKSALGMKSVKAGYDSNPGVTRADIIVAAKKEAKYGKKVKKAQAGASTSSSTKVALRPGQLKRLGKLSAKRPDKAEKVAGKMVERATRRQRGKEYLKKNAPKFIPDVPEVGKRGLKVKKARSGATLSPSKSSTSNRLSSYGRVIGKNLSKAQYGTTTPAQRRARTAASIGRQASAMRKARTAARPMQMGGKMKSCRGGCY